MVVQHSVQGLGDGQSMGMADLDHCTCLGCFEAPWGIGGYVLAPFESGIVIGEFRIGAVATALRMQRGNKLRFGYEENI